MDDLFRPQLSVDGRVVEYEKGETVLSVARRLGIEIPTLCHDPRLAPQGVCRICLVEVDGAPRLLPSCATAAAPGMIVRTDTPRVRRHRRALLALYLTDHPEGHESCETGAPCELHQLARDHQAPPDWGRMTSLRADRSHDPNPYIAFRADRCILCAKCVRYCDEVEGVNAIALARRGSETTISTVDAISLLDSTCELCGGCVAVCPTGAMTEKAPLLQAARPERDLTKVRTTCTYCGVGCQIDLNVDSARPRGDGQLVKVTPPPPGTGPNDGNLCVKGRFAFEFVEHRDRLTVPLIRNDVGEMREASWHDALDFATQGLMRVRSTHGSDALGFVSSSRCTNEENFLVQKLARAAYGTNNCHQCAAT